MKDMEIWCYTMTLLYLFILCVHVSYVSLFSNCIHFYVFPYLFYIILLQFIKTLYKLTPCFILLDKLFQSSICIELKIMLFLSNRSVVKCGPVMTRIFSLQWRHNGRDGVPNHQPPDYLVNGLFRRRSKKTWKFRVTGLCAWNSPGTGEFPAQMTSNAENVSIWWRHHVKHVLYDMFI